MALTIGSPSGFRYFAHMLMVSILIMALVNSVSNVLPDETELPRFITINLSGFLLFSYSIYKGKSLTNPRKIWYNNSFISSGIALILYANTALSGAVHTYVLPIFYLVEIAIVIYLGKRLRLESDYLRFTEMTSFNNQVVPQGP